MKQVKQLLVAANADRLEQTTPRKNALLHALAELSAQRHAALLAASCDGSEAGMESWLAVVGNLEARTQWDALLALAREVKELKRVKGMLINKQLAHDPGLLNHLRMPASANTGGIYGASGRWSAAVDRRFT